MNPSKLIDDKIKDLSDWRGKILTQLRKLILETDTKITEEWKWGTPVWTHNGLVCAVGIFKDKVKFNFFQGAQLIDKNNLFNSGLEAKKTRAIDLHEGDKVNTRALKELVRAAVAFNVEKGK